tara:strand:- start:748 stop:1641 length:894 start_codon:yes stop_codon:yes gene_type:complete
MSSENNKKTIQDCYSSWGLTYYDEYYKSRNNYPPVHLKLVKDLIKKSKAKTLLDVGCGPASMLRELFPLKLDCYGFDLTKEMINEGRKIFKINNLDETKIWKGCATKKDSYKKKLKKYDSIISFGVFPHLTDAEENIVLNNIKSVLKPKGIILVEARNSLFSMFTQNRYTSDFLRNELLGFKDSKINCDLKEIDLILKKIEKNFNMKEPEIRNAKDGVSGYDQILSKTNNPFILKKKFEALGFKKVNILFYHFHAFPPMYQKQIPKTFVKRSLELEDPYDWRGFFLASAFVIFAKNE